MSRDEYAGAGGREISQAEPLAELGQSRALLSRHLGVIYIQSNNQY